MAGLIVATVAIIVMSLGAAIASLMLIAWSDPAGTMPRRHGPANVAALVVSLVAGGCGIALVWRETLLWGLAAVPLATAALWLGVILLFRGATERVDRG